MEINEDMEIEEVIVMDDSHLQVRYDEVDFSRGKYPNDCCVCGRNLASYSRHPNGSNPDPIKMKGRVCDECHKTKTLPLRIDRIKMGMSPTKNIKSVVGWGPNGVRYFREDGYEVRINKKVSQLLWNGKVVKEKIISENRY